MAEGSGARLSCEGLRFSYGERAFELSVPSFSLEPGEQVACIGPSGCGKTTLLHLAAGLLLPDAGSVHLDGVSWQSLDEAARRRRRIAHVGLVFQELELLEHLSVRENLLLPYFVQRSLRIDEAVEGRLAALTRATGLAALLARRPRALSQGERQRVAVCRALLPRPGLLLADEPTGNLDPETGRRVVDTLRTEATRSAASLLVVTHDHERLGEFDRVFDLGASATAHTTRGTDA